MLAEHREVRVTPRQSVRKGFVAPDLSPVRTVDAELDKGLIGWSDYDVRLDVPKPDSHRPRGLMERELDRMSCGTNPPRRRKIKPIKLK